MPILVGADPEVQRTAITLVVVTAMLALTNRRLLAVPLMLQYVLVGALVGGDITDPIFAIRLTLGVAISTIIYISGGHLDKALGAGAPMARSMGPTFRLAALVWAMVMALGIWYAYPLANLPAPLGLTAYVLAMVGMTLALVSDEPLRMGVGALLILTGFEAVYLSLEASLLVVALLGTLDILVALAISFGSESWIEASLDGGAP